MQEKNIESASQFTVGSVLGRTNTILFMRPGMFFILALVTLIPAMILQFIGDGEATKPVASLMNLFLSMLIQGSFAYGVFQVIMGNPVTLGDCLSRGMSRIFPLIGAALLSGIGVGFGMLLLIVPGFILLCMWAVVTPSCVVERLGPIASIKRSTELTKGYRWKVFGILMAANLLVQFVAFAAGFIVALLAPALGKEGIAVILTIVLVPPQAFLCIIYTTIYYDLRTVKEGLAIDSLANVFD